MARRLIDGAAILLLAGALILQWRAGSILLGGSIEGDQSKHFTSGVMVFDYLRHGLGSNPVGFAEEFEVQYPLVAIGQWPPMYYAIQSVWYFITGPSIRSAQALSAVMAAFLALALFFSLHRLTGIRIAAIAAAVFLSTPLVQEAAWRVMSDLLTGVFVYLAIVAFAKLLDEPRHWKAAAWFAAFGVAAVLSKGSAWALGPFVPLAPLLCRRMRFFRNRWVWGAGMAVVAIGGCYYLWTKRAGIGYHANLAHIASSEVGLAHRWEVLRGLLPFAPAVLLGAGVVGLAAGLNARWRRGDDSPATTLSLVAAAWVLAQLLFLFVLPLTREMRVLMPSLAPLAVLAAKLAVRARHSLRRWPVLADAAPVLIGAVLLAASGAAPVQRLAGYREVADAMPYPPDGALILVATGDFASEGAVITERLSRGQGHHDVILRASHDLAELDSAKRETGLLMNSPEEVRGYLLKMPVRFILLDTPPLAYRYQALIDEAVTGDPADFHLIGRFPMSLRPGDQFAEVRLYENPAGRDHHPDVIQTRLGQYAGGRMLTYHWR
jgi:hypothetical protein